MTTGTLIALIAAAVLLIVVTVIFVIAIKTVKKDKDESVALVRESYERTMNELKARGFEMTDSKTNFIFVRHPGLSGETYFLALRQRGILVRHFTGKRICEYNRITVGSREEMEALIAATDEILREAGVNHD